MLLLLLLHEQAAEEGLGEAPGRECTIQPHHHCHQCNEGRSVLSTERQGEGERVDEMGGGGGCNGESKEKGVVVSDGDERSREYSMGG